VSIFEPRMWSVMDIACLKWSSILFGAIVGAYVSSFVQAYVWVFVLAVVVLGIRPAMMYFGPRRPHSGHPTTTAGAPS